MKPCAIVYTSNTGFTRSYAQLLGELTGLPVYPLDTAVSLLGSTTPVLYLGWLMDGKVVDCKKAVNNLDVRAIVGVGLAATGTQTAAIRKSTGAPADVAVFSLQGGMDHSKLTGKYKKMIDMLIRVLSLKRKRSPEEEARLTLLREGGNFVSEDNLTDVLLWLAGA